MARSYSVEFAHIHVMLPQFGITASHGPKRNEIRGRPLLCRRATLRPPRFLLSTRRASYLGSPRLMRLLAIPSGVLSKKELAFADSRTMNSARREKTRQPIALGFRGSLRTLRLDTPWGCGLQACSSQICWASSN